ncbi:aminotransferase class I/II-fold pyridoxal phosphate-dependent enzyme [Streptomyces lasiicapitis]|uniref:aminotransferase class I/II-fold pyridoxal phosphate-dependent enzyme n=1 Tax=Streptomyces lasiicapitis TaxID=1923961 RepID=UPI0036683FA4
MTQGPTETHGRGDEPRTLVALLRHHAADRPDALAYRFLGGTEAAGAGVPGSGAAHGGAETSAPGPQAWPGGSRAASGPDGSPCGGTGTARPAADLGGDRRPLGPDASPRGGTGAPRPAADLAGVPGTPGRAAHFEGAPRTPGPDRDGPDQYPGGSPSWTFAELDLRARRVAALLQHEGATGEPVLLLHPPGLDYIAAFLGCLYAGAVAVPAYPPDTRRFGQTMPRLAAIARDSRATHALTTGGLSRFAGGRREELAALGLGGLRWLVTGGAGDGPGTSAGDGPGTSADGGANTAHPHTVSAADWREPDLTGDSLAFLQYTSGSTSAPKGVMVSHGNLLHNLAAIHRRLAHDADSAMVSWLPPYHDMGLIGGILSPLYGGFPAHLMAPMAFVRRPLLWLETLSDTRASTSVAPDFGFEACVRRITDEELDRLDLSHWRLALNGAEPVRADTLDRFVARFGPCGFRRGALLPCYGLAEATLMVTGVRAHDQPVVGEFDAAALGSGVATEATAASGERVTRVVGCGPAVDGVDVAVVDPRTRRRVAGEGAIGEVWITGGSVAQGYWRQPDATEDTFRARVDGEPDTPYLRTGDLGFLRDGQLHVVGRTKDVVIVQGRNHYPHDIELTVEQADSAVRPGSGAAFAVEVDGAEQLVVAYEIDGRRAADAPALLARLRSAIADRHEVAPHAVVLLKRSTVHKTTSGKIQRQACRKDFLDLGLKVVAASVTRDTTEGPRGLRHGRPVGAVVEEVVRAYVPDVTYASEQAGAAGRSFADIGLDYPRLLALVRELERRVGVPIPVGELLGRPRVDTLTELLADRVPAGGDWAADSVESWLTARVGERLGLAPELIDPERPLASLGLDSKQAVAVLAELSARTGREIPSTAVFDHPTIRAIAAHLAATGAEAAEPVATDTGAVAADGRDGGQEPIAVVGIGCRFPGAPDPDSYWRLLRDGRDAITEVPAGRWDARRVAAPDFGGFLDGVEEFDARFFGLSARETARMDPQQRLLLETAWRTLEDAGRDPASLAGSATGVFVGISSHDYTELQMGRLDTVDVYGATGNAHAIAANRLSYALDLRGPSLALDTACSSSLTAVHLACDSLRRGECATALAGGVNLMLTPGLSVAFTDGGMLSADGRCRTFDDAAGGYVRGEGVGLVCLKPLSAALADGDRVHAVIRGSATGHGGRGNGLTAPKGSAQHSVIEQALARAELSGKEVDYVEAHGTGTPLGDPVEWEGLAAAYGMGRPDGAHCLVGSVKTNIGHLEAAAGIAGLIKAALVVRDREVPPTLHLTTPNRRLDWDGAGLDVPTRLTALPGEGPVRAAVSSFGFGGANAHVVLESPPPAVRESPAEPTAPEARPVQALCLSGHTPTALTTLARHWRTHLAAHPEAPVADLCRAASTGRARLAHRAVVVGGSAGALDAGLDALARGEASTAVTRGTAGHGPGPKVAFLFSGQGTQYTGMANGLYDTHAPFARTIDRADAVLRPHLEVPLTDLLFTDGGAERLRATRYCQPALVALEVALAELWLSLGVRPTAVLGHSVGAYAAACVAGAMSFEDALTLAATRGRLMDEQPGDGAMIACLGDAETVREVAAGFGSLSVAAVNSPTHLVLSGERAEVDAARTALVERSVVVKPLAVSGAFHSALMAGAAGPLREAARSVRFAEPVIPWVSDATGETVGRIDADALADHLLGTVRFADGFTTLRRLGCTAFVEAGPHPTLLGLGRAMTLASPESDAGSALWLPSLRRGRAGAVPGAAGDWETLLQSLGRLHCAGGAVDWAALDEGRRGPHVPVPHAVFEREAYWFTPPEAEAEATTTATAPATRRGADAPPDVSLQLDIPLPEVPLEPRRVTEAVVPPTAPPPGARQEVFAQVSLVCGHPVAHIPRDARLGADLGFDSLMRTDLERALMRRFPGHLNGNRERLPEDPTVGQLADLLDGAVPEGAPMASVAHAAPSSPAPAAEPVPQEPPPLTVRQERVFEEWPEYAELQGRLRQATADGDNPYGRTHEGFNGGRSTVDGRPVLNFSAFNYLALSHHPRVREAARAAVDRYGTSCSATPLLFGETPLHHQLDAEIASFLGTEAAIVFAGGHATNVATIGHLFGPEDLILHDEWIHDSAVRGSVLSGARRRPFPHNDWRALDRLLGASRARARRALVLVEGAYSQDGDLPDLPKFIDVKKRHGAMLMVDEAHSLGVLGRTGRGIGEYFGVDRADVDLWMGTLSKAVGSLGGYVAARQPLVEYLKFTAPLHIFSTGISPANTAAALEALRVLRSEPERVARLRHLAEHFRDSARARGLDIGVSRASAVVPVVIGGWEETMALSNALLRLGVNVMPIGHPAVPRDECRLRFFINADHTERELDRALDLLGRAMAEHRTNGTSRTGRDSGTGTGSGTSPSAATTPSPAHEPSLDPSPASTAPDVLVAGAGGFIGGHLTRRLAERGHRVRVLVRDGSDRSAFAGVDVDVAVGDLGDPDSLRRAAAGVRHVYNCAGLSADWGPWADFARVNVDGSRNLVEAAAHAGTVERFLHVSTTDVYGYPVRPCAEDTPPRDIGLPYNRSKLLGEQAVREAAARAGLPLTVVRPVSVYGPRSKDFVIEIATLLLSRQMVHVRGGDAPAGLLYVTNAADAMIAACASDAAAGRTYNLRDPDRTTWREYVGALAHGLGVKPPALSLPAPVARGLATVSEGLYGALRIKARPVLTRHAVHLLDRDQSYAIDRARDDFGFKSEVGFEEGVRLTLAWLDSPEGRDRVPR